jgi:SAM-dependent methyltransferase
VVEKPNLAELAGDKDGISERFVPDKDRGRLIEAEHLTRYHWAAQAVAGAKVLDAGCGAAYGTKLLADAGAEHVTGIDLAGSVLEAMSPYMPANVTLEQGDLLKLPHDSGSFEAIACFEVIEHFAEPLVVLDELKRVLSNDGVLFVSSPNRGVFPAGNPHHLHEFTPEELRTDLLERFTNVELVRQRAYLVSAALNDDSVAISDGSPVVGLTIDKVSPDEPGRELYTLAIASNGPLPNIGQLGVLTGSLEFGEWLSIFDEQTYLIQLKDNQIRELEAQLGDRDRLASLLIQAEQQLAGVPALNLQIEDQSCGAGCP